MNAPVLEMTVEQDIRQYYWLAQIATRGQYWMFFWGQPHKDATLYDAVHAKTVVICLN